MLWGYRPVGQGAGC
ncbi:unnamed protein product [Cuscuta europaea]|uniref:Uncharacterized protein n=1 Tax=Cuscuta europaea TaxID=41803 RepID=A0A9P1EAY0_CUSEU|nr:unnamed protein product [Cuscuta europaea]